MASLFFIETKIGKICFRGIAVNHHSGGQLIMTLVYPYFHNFFLFSFFFIVLFSEIGSECPITKENIRCGDICKIILFV